MNIQVQTAFTESRLQLGDRHINYAESADNGPPLLFIHGISGRWQDWFGVVDAFADDWHIYGVDLRGHGKSSWAADEYHWRLYAEDQAELIERVIGEPAFVVGHSLGGATALGLNALRSDLVRAAVYEDPPLFLQRRPPENNEFRIRFSETLEVLDSNRSYDAVFAHVRESYFDLDDARCHDRTEKLMAMDPEVYRSTLSGRARANWRTEDFIGQAEAPGLLLQAEPTLGSALDDEEAAEAMTMFPDAEFEKWDDSGHGMHSSFPKRFSERVKKFFERYR